MDFSKSKPAVTKGQMNYEANHLKKKLKTFDPEKFKEINALKNFDAHPMFKVWKKVLKIGKLFSLSF